MKWCSKDYYDRPMWCERSVCLSRDEFTTKTKYKREPSKDLEEGKESIFFNKNFKIALAAMISLAG